MTLKYKVPPQYYKMFDNKNTIYCEVLRTIKVLRNKVYLVRMINHNNTSNVFEKKELQRLNIIDRIKLIKLRRKNKCIN